MSAPAVPAMSAPAVPAMSTPISIRFPMAREKTGNRTGPRYYRIPVTEGLQGAARCAAGMICIAIRKRRAWLRSVEDLRRAERYGKQDTAWLRLCVELDAHSVRESALWARRFAKGIADTDPRFVELATQDQALRARLHEHTQRALAA